MEFSNPAIDLASLPKVEEVSLQKIEPSYWKVLQISWLISSLVLLIAGAIVIYFIKGLQTTRVVVLGWGIWVFFIALRYLIMRQSFIRKAYMIREKDMLYRSGWIIQSMHVCPFNRIQHCSVHSGPFQRRYGLASISFFTAGTEGSDVSIHGLKEATASSIREFIMQKIKTDEQAAG